MDKLDLSKVTLVCVDCVEINRAIKAIEICKKHANFGNIKLLSSLESDYEHLINIEKISNLNEYSKFIIRDLVDYVDTDFVLIVQWDGYILNPEAWNDENFKYDYIGAPWVHLNQEVGNGGFSLRSKRMLEITKKHLGKLSDYSENEDYLIGHVYKRLFDLDNIEFAPFHIANKFSVETKGFYEGEFGFHDFKYINPKIIDFNKKGILKTKTKAILITAYCDTAEKESNLIQLIKSFKHLDDYLIIVSSHYALSVSTQVITDICIFDSNNQIDKRMYSHGVAECMLIEQALGIIEAYGITDIYKFTFDCPINDTSILNKWKLQNKQFVSALYDGWGISVLCFYSNIKFLKDNFHLFRNIDEMFDYAINNKLNHDKMVLIEKIWENDIKINNIQHDVYLYESIQKMLQPNIYINSSHSESKYESIK